MVDELSTRRYRPTDAGAVWRLNERTVRNALGRFDPDPYADLHDIERTYLRTGDFLVGTRDEAVVAMGGVRPTRGERTGETVDICRVRVDPDHRGRGYGWSIVEALERSAEALGFDVLRGESCAISVGTRDRTREDGAVSRPRWTVTGDPVTDFEKQL